MARLLNRLGARRLVMLAALAVVLCICGIVAAEVTTQPASTTTAPAPQMPSALYGLWTLVPPLVAIILAVLTRQVVAALFVGTLVASYMLLPCGGVEVPFAETNVVIRGLRVAMERYIVEAIQNTDHIQIMIFTMAIGAMVGVVGANGGTRSVVEVLSRWAGNSRRGQFAGWLGGHAVFFDDYANTMILGPTLRPLYDRLRISRAKLAYIVDSTAAPVASLVPIGTWIGAEIGYIEDGLDGVITSAAEAGQAVPAILEGVNGYSVFLASIGYRFYAIFALALVLIIALTRRDFGPMKRAERQAAAGTAKAVTEETGGKVQGRWWYALFPVLLMVSVTVLILLVTGWQGFPQDERLSLGTVRYLLVEADPYASILYGGLAGLTLAILISVFTGTLRTRAAVDAGLEGMARMFPAIVILILAWSLSESTKALQLGQVVSETLKEQQFNAVYLPMAVFGAACLVSFATGSSWGTMGILCPVAVQVAAKLCGDMSVEAGGPLFNATVGAVLAGAIFGDHCSPISDTTVLSSLASSCTLEQHVWTQMPYALLAALIGVAAGNVLCNVWGQPWWLGLLVGVGALLVIIMVVGRRTPEAVTMSAGT